MESKRFRIFRSLIIWHIFYVNFMNGVNGDCSCYNIFTNQSYQAGTCCNLGSTNCDSTMKYEAVCTQNGQICPRTVYSTAAGHFISASISWTATGPNSVEFEIISTWRLSFSWPYPLTTAYSGPCGYPGIGDTVPIVGISADPSDPNPQQTATGSVSVQLNSGNQSFFETNLDGSMRPSIVYCLVYR